MCTTMTTVGYGDEKPMNESEWILMSCVMFFGLAMFTIISNQTMSLRKESGVEDLVKERNEHIVNFLYELSQRRHTISLDGEIYQECKKAIEENLRYSTKETFKSEFWKSLTPQIKNRIVRHCLSL